MVEAIANGVEDKLIDGLSFKLNPGASYVVDRRSVTFNPQGSNIHMPGQGTKLIRILLTGDNWMDPSTFRIMFNLNNLDTTTPPALPKNLRPLGGPWTFFRRMRILCAGQLVEDIMDYNRIHEMIHMMIAKESRAITTWQKLLDSLGMNTLGNETSLIKMIYMASNQIRA